MSSEPSRRPPSRESTAVKLCLSATLILAFVSPLIVDKLTQPTQFVPEQALREIALLDPAFMHRYFPHIQVDGCGLEYSDKRREYVYVGTSVIAKLIPTTSDVTVIDISGRRATVTEIIDWSLGTTTKIDSTTNRTMYYRPYDGTWRDFNPPPDYTISH